MVDADDRDVTGMLREAFAEPIDVMNLLPGVRARVLRRRRWTGLGAATAIAAVAAGVTIPIAMTAGGGSAASQPAAWAVRCLERNHRIGEPVKQFLGLSHDAFTQHATQEHLRVEEVARTGHCVTALTDLVAARHVYVAFDANDRVAGAWLQPS